MTERTYGKFEARAGERCSNSPGIDRWTTPCCYSDQLFSDDTQCSECGAPIACTFEAVEIAVCTIVEDDDG